MATQPTKKKSSLETRLVNLKAGADKHFDNNTSITLKGTDYNLASVDAELDALIVPYTDLDGAKAKVKVEAAAVKAAEPQARQFADAMTAGVKAFFGPDDPAVEDFGIVRARPRTQLTSEQKLAKAAKAKHTRELRGTKTPKEKAALKSTAAVTVTATLAPSGGSPAPTAAGGSASGSTPTNVAPAPAPAGSTGSVVG